MTEFLWCLFYINYQYFCHKHLAFNSFVKQTSCLQFNYSKYNYYSVHNVKSKVECVTEIQFPI
jgi:hypothetical protein